MRIVALLVVLALVAPASAQADDPLTEAQRAWLDANGPLRVGLPVNVPPASWEVGGEHRGWAPDLIELAVLKVGGDLEFVLYDAFADIRPALDAGEIHLTVLGPRPDIVDGTVSTTPLLWSPTMFVAGPMHPEFVDVGDITGRTSALPGSPMETTLREQFPHLQYVATDNVTHGIDLLVAGAIDSYLGPLAPIGHEIQRQQLQGIRPVGDPISTLQVRGWGLESNPVPIQILQAGLDRTSKEEMAIIHVKWTGFDLTEPSTDVVEYPPWLLPVALGLVAIAIIAWGWVVLLRRQVRIATHDLQQLNDELEERIEERTQELNTRSEELEASNERLERFAYMASHELQAPLRHISSFAEFLHEDLDGQLGEEDEQHLKGIQEGVGRMRERIQALLTFSRVQRVDLNFAPVSMADVVAAAAADVEAELSEAAGDLEVGPMPTVHGDRTLLIQVMYNLLQNAIQYRGEQPLKIQVLGETTPAGHQIHVVDNGRGFAAEHAERIFGMFKRLENKQGGSGIGLAVCRVIIERHGGTIEAGAHPGEGSTFTITLPPSPS